MSIESYKINVPQSKIDRLKQKLALIDLPHEVDGVGWNYGSPLGDIHRLINYWQNEFDWRKAETELNELPQFMTRMKIDGFDKIDLHFVHAKSPNPGAIPLLFCHGWPGSFEEITKMLPLLLDGGEDGVSFDVVAPSMPNYGFSSFVKQPGFGTKATADVFNKLMTEVLGYDEYVTQGGDIGYGVTRFMGWKYPQHCKGSHYNMPRPDAPSKENFPELYEKYQSTPRTQAELAGFERSKWFMEEGRGYFGEHATKPQTIGYSLTDSPVGLLSWIYEKLHDWTDDYPFTDYEVIKWISIYWFSTPGPMPSMLVYYDAKHSDPVEYQTVRAGYLKDVKIGCSNFPKELHVTPPLWNHTLGDLVFNAVHETGGHFAAFEKPELLANDLRQMFGKNGGAYGIVRGKPGHA